MATRRLTKTVVQALPSRDKVYIVYDDTLHGFGVRVTPNGARSWIVEYRPHGGGRGVGKRRITLGAINVLTPDQARDAAGDVLAKVRFGEDAPHDRAARRGSPLVSELIEEFMREEVRPIRKARTAELYELYFRLHVIPILGTKRAREVTVSDVSKLHRKVGAKAPVTANRVVALISGLYSWAARSGRVPDDVKPARGISKFREQGRSGSCRARSSAGSVTRFAKPKPWACPGWLMKRIPRLSTCPRRTGLPRSRRTPPPRSGSFF